MPRSQPVASLTAKTTSFNKNIFILTQRKLLVEDLVCFYQRKADNKLVVIDSRVMQCKKLLTQGTKTQLQLPVFTKLGAECRQCTRASHTGAV